MKAFLNYHKLIFKQAAGTSRGILRTKPAWFIKLTEGTRSGIGEVSLLPGLSFDDAPNFKTVLADTVAAINSGKSITEVIASCQQLPSISFALESALLSLHSENGILFNTNFTKGNKGIPINGLIWMGDKSFMKSQINKKLEDGYRCIKLKIGAIDQNSEFDLLNDLRKHYSSSDLEIRVDANGAYSPEEAPLILEKLSRLNIHSIEQPIRAGQWEQMAQLCKDTPVPIALDEELIGIFDFNQKQSLLEQIKPQFIILKPGLIGGFKHCEEWISLQKQYPFNWWATSALESNIGLDAIAQWTASTGNPLPQGLGTGLLYSNNVDSPLTIKHAMLWRDVRG